MSKSKGNIVVPDTVAEVYGADVLRTYMMFMGPFDATMAWNERALVGVRRFIEKVFKLVTENTGKYAVTDLENMRIIHRLIKKTEEDLSGFKFNTAIAGMMEATNDLLKAGSKLANSELSILVKLLAPFAPFVAEEMWSILRNEFSVHSQKFPELDEKYLVEEKIVLSIQINGKHRGTIEVAPGTEEGEVSDKAKKSEKIAKYLVDKELKKTIYLKGKMINFVVG
jgi:leucyl-tRNA synthetase